MGGGRLAPLCTL